MSEPAGARLAYRVDADDRLVDVAGEWDAFAVANGAPDLRFETLRGRSLPVLVTGPEMRLLTAQLLKRARARGELVLPFRCDAPERRRFLTMRLRAAGDGGVWIETTLERVEPRAPVALLDARVPRADELLVVCSWCRQVRLDGRWVEAEEAVEALGLFDAPRLPRISHGICPPCRAHFFA